jgi:KDO2-lipid IV(A) lauroyltransferase
MIKRFRRRIYYYGAWVISKLVLLIPYKWAVGFISTFFGSIAPYLTRDASDIARANLHLAFGDMPKEKIDRIVRNVFINQAKNFFELANFPKLDDKFLSEISSIDNVDLIMEGIKKGRGILFVSAHTGNWEITAAAVAKLGVKVNVVAKKIYIDGLNDMLVNYRRQKNVNVILRESKDSARQLLRALKNGEIIAMLIDQDTNVPSVFVDFFGHPASTPSGLASLALRTHATVLIGIDCRIDKYKHKTIVRGPIEIEPTDDNAKNIIALTQKATLVLEDHIRQYPDQWVWFHKRWNTKKAD